jgi:hypothetical protein
MQPEHELKKYCDMVAKRVYPETEQEKKCIEKFGKMIIKRSKLSKAIISFISKYNDATPTQENLDKRTQPDSPAY